MVLGSWWRYKYWFSTVYRFRFVFVVRMMLDAVLALGCNWIGLDTVPVYGSRL